MRQGSDLKGDKKNILWMDLSIIDCSTISYTYLLQEEVPILFVPIRATYSGSIRSGNCLVK